MLSLTNEIQKLDEKKNYRNSQIQIRIVLTFLIDMYTNWILSEIEFGTTTVVSENLITPWKIPGFSEFSQVIRSESSLRSLSMGYCADEILGSPDEFHIGPLGLIR